MKIEKKVIGIGLLAIVFIIGALMALFGVILNLIHWMCHLILYFYGKRQILSIITLKMELI